METPGLKTIFFLSFFVLCLSLFNPGFNYLSGLIPRGVSADIVHIGEWNFTCMQVLVGV